jgi:hypothetical protein
MPGPAAPFVMIGLAVMSAAMSVMQAKGSANAAAKSGAIQEKAAVQQTLAQYAEADRQEGQVNGVAEEQRSDRMRQATAELGTMRVLTGERGTSETTTNALLGEVGYYAGLDLSRIETNRLDNIAQGEAAKKAAQQGGQNTLDIVNNQISVANKTVGLSVLGAGLQIAGTTANQTIDYYTAQAAAEAAKEEKNPFHD